MFSIISDQRFIIVFSALISLVFGFGLFKATGNWLIIPISILIQFLIIKYWIIPLWGNEIDEKKRELKIELMVFEESKKNNLSNKKDQWIVKNCVNMHIVALSCQIKMADLKLSAHFRESFNGKVFDRFVKMFA